MACTFFPDAWWKSACKQHDADYAAHLPRFKADYRLFTGIVSASLSAGGWRAPVGVVAAFVAFAGVRLMGWWWYGRAKA